MHSTGTCLSKLLVVPGEEKCSIHFAEAERNEGDQRVPQSVGSNLSHG